MELKQIEIKKVFPNFSQPREKFDKEKIKELAESILGNGLINPITVRQDGKKFFIVAGERRWTAYKVAKLNKIDAFVKKYKNEGEWMIESLIENVHREDLNITEKGKYLIKIKEVENIPNNNQLAKRVNLSLTNVGFAIDSVSVSEKVKGPLTYTQISETKYLDEKDRMRVIKKAQKEEIGNRSLRALSKAIKNAPDDVKETLFNDEITTDQAERISKLKDEAARTKAIQEHKNIAVVSEAVETNVENQMTAREKRERDKDLMKAGNWITSFRNSTTSSRRELEKTIKILLIATKFVNIMDEKQKEKLDDELDRFIEMLERGEQLANQIKNQL